MSKSSSLSPSELLNPIGSYYNSIKDVISKTGEFFKNVILGDLTPEDIVPQSAFINNGIWKFDVVFDNKSVEPFVLPVNQIHEFQITQNILDPVYLSGVITLKSKRLRKILNNDELNTEYVFRGDGDDVLTFRINPQTNDALLPDDVWMMDMICRVYDVEDIPGKGTHMKKIYFYHEPIHIFRNRNVPFSTANYVESQTPVYLLKDDDKKIYTGDAIKYLLIESGLEEYIDEENWDRGSSKIFYTSPSNGTTQDDLQNLLRVHVSEEGSYICLLYYNRGIKKFQLLSIKHFFDNAYDEGGNLPGEYQLDHVWIVPKDIGEYDLKTVTLLEKKAPIDENPSNNKKDIKLKNLNIISEESFSLSEMSGDKSMWKLISTPVHTYSHDKKRFTTYVEDNDISNIKKLFKEEFSDKLYPGKKGDCLLTLNSEKIKHRSVKHVFYGSDRTSGDSYLNRGRNNVLFFSIFDNLTIQMILSGSTHRQAGRFVAIEKNEYHDTKYHYKLLGQWFVVKSTLIFKDNNLLNDIEAVKINTHGSLKLKEE